MTTFDVERRAEHYRERRDEHRERGLARLGGVCVGCGTANDLDFHHVDPTTKSFEISTWLLSSWDYLVPEIDKCELRCRGCHTDEHRSTAVCGTVQRYWRGCRCDPCRAAMSAYNRDYQERRPPRRKVAPKPKHLNIVHGTRSGYLKERRQGLATCEACRAANTVYTNELNRRKRSNDIGR